MCRGFWWRRYSVFEDIPSQAVTDQSDPQQCPPCSEREEGMPCSWRREESRAEFVVRRYRNAGQNLRTQFEKIILRAGLKPWQKPFQNLRSSRVTELSRLHPLHVVVNCMGNSQAVALGHYLQVQQEDFQRAASEPTPKRVQNWVQQGHAPSGTASHPLPQKCENPAEISRVRGVANRRKSLQSKGLPPVGLEAKTSCMQIPAKSS